MQRPSITRFPDRRIAHLPSYTGPFRRAEDQIHEQRREHERGLTIVRIFMWLVCGFAVGLAIYWSLR